MNHCLRLVLMSTCFACLVPAAAFAQYKCIGPDKKTAFQQAPCPPHAQQAELFNMPSAGLPDQANARRIKGELAASNWRAAVENAIGRGYPLVGMSRTDLDRAMGLPNAINTSDYGRGVEEQLVYYRGSRTLHVYTRGGAVSSIQNTQGSAVATAASSKDCWTRQEYANQETSISSITISAAERERLRSQLNARPLCP